MRGRSIYSEQFDFVEYYRNLKLLDFTSSEAAKLAIELIQNTEGRERNDRLKQVCDKYLEKMVVLQCKSSSKPTSTRDPHAGADHERPRLRSRACKSKSPEKLGGKAHSSSAETKSTSPAKFMIPKVEKGIYECATNFQDVLQVDRKAESSMDKQGGKRRAACTVGDNAKQKHGKKSGTGSRPNGNKRARGMQCENVKEEPHDTKDRENDINSNDIDATKEWISVPLEGTLRGGGTLVSSDDDGEDGESVQCSVKLRTEEIASAFGSVSKVMQNGMKFLEIFESDITDAAYKEVRNFYTNAKSMVDDVERVIHTITEKQIQKLHAEKAQIEETKAAEYQSLRKEIDCLSKENLAVRTKNLHAEEERDNIKKDLLSELEKAREDLRVEKQKEHGKANDALKRELEMEHDKDCCQICFAASRDALILPCMHFHYCNDCLQKHQRRNGECPTCRTKINGVLRCHINTA